MALLRHCVQVLRLPRQVRRWSDAAAGAFEFEYNYGEAAYAYTSRLRLPALYDEQPQVLRPGDNALGFGALQNCVVAVKKPAASVTFDLIDQARTAMGAQHYCIGHSGSLTVMESGLVLLLFGHATKKSTFYFNLEREYAGTLRLGQTTPTFDVLSPIETTRPWSHLSGTTRTSNEESHASDRAPR